MFLISERRDWYLTGNNIEWKNRFYKSVFANTIILSQECFQHAGHLWIWTFWYIFNTIERKYVQIINILFSTYWIFLLIKSYCCFTPHQFFHQKCFCKCVFSFSICFSMFKVNEWCMRIYRIARPMMDKGRN